MDSNAKIIIVDNHPLFREGIKLLIEQEIIGEVIGEAENGLRFLELLKGLKPDLVLMEIEMPVMDGIEAAIKAIGFEPDLKILILTRHLEKENYKALIDVGVRGCVTKTAGKKELEKAIKTVLIGQKYF